MDAVTRELLVEVLGGLCNRLRVFISASYLAERYRRKLLLCWRPDDECGARFSDLFTNAVTEIDSLPANPPALTGQPLGAVTRAVLSAEPVVCVCSYRQLVSEASERKVHRYFRELRPVEAVRQTVETVAGTLGRRAIGVHVRRGDFAKFLPEVHQAGLPTLERYFVYLDGCRGSIFLATDGGDEVETAFRDRYGDRVVTYPKRCPGRNTPEAIQDALIDLYLLQRCRAVVGTRHSSFSALAAVISGVPRAKVSDQEASTSARLRFSLRMLLSGLRR